MAILGPYFTTKLVKKYEQPLAQMAFDQNQHLQSAYEDESPDLKKMLKASLLTEVIPESVQALIKHFEHFHLALFFIWKRYYELARRFCGIVYKKNRNDKQGQA